MAGLFPHAETDAYKRRPIRTGNKAVNGGASDGGASNSVAGQQQRKWGGGWLCHVGVGQRLSTQGGVFGFWAQACLQTLEDPQFL